jgi:alkylation response protein AidB-like acyl-CoA dehydrogenase
VVTSPFDWPFFTDAHRTFASELRTWATRELSHAHETTDVDADCRALVKQLGDAGWLRYAVPAEYGGMHDKLDVRSHLHCTRNAIARIGARGLRLRHAGTRRRTHLALWLSRAEGEVPAPHREGDAIGAFAISESEAGSDIGAMRTSARLDHNEYVINGAKTWISNGGIADQYVVFCRLDSGARDFIALVVEPGDKGFSIGERISTIAPHPLATLHFDECRVPMSRVIGEPGRGLRVALGTLDVFRSTVGAAALGMARRALDETLA